MKTISRSHTKKIDAIFATAKDGKVYSLDNGFLAKPCSVRWIRKQLDDGCKSTRLIDDGNGQYMLCVHNNLWYTFTA